MKMVSVLKWSCCCLVMVVSLALAVVVQAEKPAWAGEGGKGGKPPKKEKYSPDTGGKKGYETSTSADVHINAHVYFTDRHRNVIRDYYRQEYRAGHCPPGLAKKNNGCMPPGQAKKWRVGYPLPHDVTVYDLPAGILVQLGNPPAGHRYVRVASDILMIAVGTGLIVDAIQDLNSM